MSNLSILVTGGAGYIGSHAVLALRDSGWTVAVIDDLSNGTRDVVPAGVPFFEGSIADRALVDRVLAEQQIGAIMHFAGSIVVPESVERPLEYYANNTLASHSLISAAVAAGAQTEIGGNDRYVALCRRHFFERLRESEARQLSLDIPRKSEPA